MIYLPAIVSVSMYFEKKRAFATGIAVCGSGLGTFIMAPVTKGLVYKSLVSYICGEAFKSVHNVVSRFPWR